MNSATAHARWFTPSDHVSGGLVLEECSAGEGSLERTRSSLEVAPNTAQPFAQHVARAIAAVCRDHAIETVVLCAPNGDYLALAAELPRLARPIPTLVPTDPTWADLSTAELCARMEDAGMIKRRPRGHTAAGDSRDPGAISGAGAQFVASGLTPFERQRMS